MKILESNQGKKCNEDEYRMYTHKKCSTCKKTKEIRDFYQKKAKTKRGWMYDSQCKECSREECRNYAVSNRNKRNKRLRDWRKNNPSKARDGDKKARYKRVYGMTLFEVEMMKKTQDNRCYLCRSDTAKRLVIDHNHKNGKVRKLICDKCNSLIGWIETNVSIEIIIEYLK